MHKKELNEEFVFTDLVYIIVVATAMSFHQFQIRSHTPTDNIN